jgi:hypothetical protein
MQIDAQLPPRCDFDPVFDGDEPLPWPLYVSIQGCNVLISDSLQEDAQVKYSLSVLVPACLIVLFSCMPGILY